MADQVQAQSCRCGQKLARDNRVGVCGRCQRNGAANAAEAPVVPAGFWTSSVPLAEALDAWHMGRVVGAYRMHPFHGAPIAQETVSNWIGITQAQLSRIESGPPISDLRKLIRWAEVLRIPEDLLWFKMPKGRQRSTSVTVPVDSPSTVDNRRAATVESPPSMIGMGGASARVVTELGEVVVVALDRRAFLAGTGAGLFLGGSVLPLTTYRRVAPEAPEYLSAQIDGFYAAEAILGPHATIPSALVQEQLIQRMLRVATGSVRHDLLRVHVAYSGLITWLYQDAGDLSTASYWANQALEFAHRVSDVQLIRHALTNKAMILTDGLDGPGTVDLASAALADETSLCAKVRVQAMQQSAHGFSLMNDRDSVDYILDRAAQLLASVDDDYPWFNACRRNPAYIEAQRATCYVRLGLGVEAVRLWDDVISSLPASSRRDAGVYRARQAIAHIQAGMPDAIVSAVGDAVAISNETNSARLRQELQVVWRRLEPWRGEPVARQVRDLLSQHQEGS